MNSDLIRGIVSALKCSQCGQVMDAYSMTVTGASALPRTCSSVAISDGGGATAVCGAALGGAGCALPAVVVLAVVPVVGGGVGGAVSAVVVLAVVPVVGGVGGAVSAVVVLAVVPVVGGVACGPGALGVATALDGDVPVSGAFCVDVLGLAGWTLAAGGVFVAVLAVGAGAGVPRGGTSRFRT